MVQNLFQSAVDFIGIWPAIMLAIAIGMSLLNYGADWLVKGASDLGLKWGMSATLVGLTIVAFGTSAPEMVVSLMTAGKGEPELCIGNVLGSNIANTTLVLGITAMIFPLKAEHTPVRLELFLSCGSLLGAFLLAFWDGELGRLDGILLLSCFAWWMSQVIRPWLKNRPKKSDRVEETFDPPTPHGYGADILLVLAGLAGLVFGADALVAGAVGTAEQLGIPEIVIGLTVVAAGTSLPEMAVCVVAAFKKKSEITLGNILGSNIFNVLLVLALAVVVSPISFAGNGLQDALRIDLPIAILFTGGLIALMGRSHSIGRWRGFILFAGYVIYVIILIRRSAG